MKILRNPMFTGLFLPAALVVLLLGGLNMLSFHHLHDHHREALVQQERDFEQRTRIRNFNKDIATVQQHLAELLDQAIAGKLDAIEIQAARSRLLDQFVLLEKQLPELKESVGEENFAKLQQLFQEYRTATIESMDKMAMDPSAAINHAYQASRSYLSFFQKSRAIYTSAEKTAMQEDKARDLAFQEHTSGDMLNAALLILAMLAFWGYQVLHLLGKMNRVTEALNDLARGEASFATLPSVQAMAEQKRGLLGELARAVISFSETS